MSKAIISSKAFLVEGGCNACGLQSTETFTIHFADQRSEILDSFDVSSLVQTIAQKNGWRETAIPVGISEEKIVLKKGLEIVSPKYLGEQIVYQRDNQRIQTKRTFEDTAELFDKVNQILVQLFEIEPYEIERN
ncbi:MULTISPECIES: DUF4809 family protein [Enterococcus]|uniref:DUF4809 domain-containing protein n=1 Tax=Enterococcus malodoratus ATCC 43197 TaxID=1158601 RepID=R2QUQ2_9ENTE|nr:MULTISPECIES: DUF4809 family protein [Enterococcus]BBM19976.1 DUF4809 domain-containing protein [Enterococcus avium]EOH72221.1 hypothetical protein UAI_03805 [Enterococcus malodoratus ATCC 43197]EOT70454.1 hypothetical protein I585_01934 [Enterococcus malodoratus ATCC 43197]SET22841.1 protein of unknown function [Enterococcus malodoratus]SPW69544.1 Uncharacterised protein [Enterococcus malodoratus]